MSQRIEQYREFCQLEKNIPVFSQPWWLDAVCGKDNWDVALVEKGGQIFATLPYFIKRRAIFSIITMPNLTQTMGPYIKYPKNQKYYKKISWEHKMLEGLIKRLPNFSYFSQNFHYSAQNWLAFYWRGYQQTTRYTYVIDDISLENLSENFETDIRRRRRKAENLGIKVKEGHDIQQFYRLNQMTYARKNMQAPDSLEFVQRLYNSAHARQACKILFAYNTDGKTVAASFLVFDKVTVYYLMGGIDPDFADTGAMDVVLYESIKFALKTGRKFDFEGSVTQSIEKYFRSFGAKQAPYFNVSKSNSKLISTALFLRKRRRYA